MTCARSWSAPPSHLLLLCYPLGPARVAPDSFAHVSLAGAKGDMAANSVDLVSSDVTSVQVVHNTQ